MNAIKTLAQFQLWRTGADERTLDEIGLTPANISAAINGVLDELNQLKQHNAELIKENTRLREFVKRVADGDTACTLLRQYMVHSYIHSAVRILEELEGGEECAK